MTSLDGAGGWDSLVFASLRRARVAPIVSTISAPTAIAIYRRLTSFVFPAGLVCSGGSCLSAPVFNSSILASPSDLPQWTADGLFQLPSRSLLIRAGLVIRRHGEGVAPLSVEQLKEAGSALSITDICNCAQLVELRKVT